jgi:hypothetical protein
MKITPEIVLVIQYLSFLFTYQKKLGLHNYVYAVNPINHPWPNAPSLALLHIQK